MDFDQDYQQYWKLKTNDEVRSPKQKYVVSREGRRKERKTIGRVGFRWDSIA